MKFLIILILLLSSANAICQNDSSQLHIDTMRVELIPNSCDSSFLVAQWYTWVEGVNLLVDTVDGYHRMGTVHKRINIRIFLRHGRLKTLNKVGLWTYYLHDKVIGYESFDKKGNSLGKVILYENRQVESSTYRKSSKDPFEYSETFLKIEKSK